MLTKRASNEGAVPDSPTASSRPIPIAIDMLAKRTLQNQFSANSFLQPKKEIILHPNANVVVRDVRVQVGDKVTKGQVLAATDSEAQALRAELDHLDLQLKNIEYSVTVALAKKSFLSQKEYQQKQLEHKAAAIRQRLSEIESNGAIISPIDGQVSEINMKVGDYIDNPSNYSVKISDSSSYRIQLYLPQDVARKLKKGAPATLNHKKNDENGQEVSEDAAGEVATVAPSIDPKTGSVLTEIEVPNVPKGWMSGTYVQISLTVDQVENVLAVPNSAIIYENGKPFVYRVPVSETLNREPASAEPAKVAQKAPVQLGLREAKYTEVKQGLEQFDMIIVEGQGNLSDGATVEVAQ